MSHYHYGWKRQPHNPRDWHYVVPRRRLLALPPTVDLSAGMGAQLDQGQLGSCGPNTADECVMFDQHAEGLRVASISRLHLYWWTRYLMGTTGTDSGVDNRSLMKALATYGVCDESLWPYDISKFTQQPPDAANQAALQNRITSYAAVMQQLDQMQGCIAGGHPFVFGFDVFQQMEGDQAAQTGIVTDPSPTDTPVGGHDVSLCGFTTVEQPGVLPGNKWPAGTFKFRNHWTVGGKPWGDGGYGYISFAYATGANARDFWVINAVPGGSPNPTPPPPPPPAPSALLTVRVRRAMQQGSTLAFRLPVPLPGGLYDLVPHTDATAPEVFGTEIW